MMFEWKNNFNDPGLSGKTIRTRIIDCSTKIEVGL